MKEVGDIKLPDVAEESQGNVLRAWYSNWDRETAKPKSLQKTGIFVTLDTELTQIKGLDCYRMT